MALPKIEYPINKIEIPSTKKKMNFRPMLVKEEKILLMAKTSEDDTDIYNAIQQSVNNCALDKDFDVDRLTIFDLQYIFLKLRSVSVGEEVELKYIDNEDKKTYDFTVNLNDVKVNFPENIDKNIKINDTSGIMMKYPPASLYSNKEFLSGETDGMFTELVVACIDKIYSGDDIYESSLYKPEELKEFVENLDIKTYDKIRTFLNNVPALNHELTYKNSAGTERKIVLRDLNDFFTLR